MTKQGILIEGGTTMMKMKGKTIIDEQTGLVVVQAGDDLCDIRWKKIATLIENIDELWAEINLVTSEPHVSAVVANLQRLNAFRRKVQTKMDERKGRDERKDLSSVK